MKQDLNCRQKSRFDLSPTIILDTWTGSSPVSSQLTLSGVDKVLTDPRSDGCVPRT